MHPRHPLLAHTVGEKDIAFVGAFFAHRHEIAAKGVDVDAALRAVGEAALGLAKLTFIDREPMPVEVGFG
ncbi:hypothetical protein [Bradyrhizobium barranii]